LRTICFGLAIAILGAGAARAQIKRWPAVMGLTVGMTLADARALLAARKTRNKQHDDDKPVRKRSVKIKARYPDGAKADRATLYFLDGRLWQIKLRPGGKLCKELSRALGKPDASRGDLVGWVNRPRLWGVHCTREMAHLIDMGALVRAGIDRRRVERDFKGFVGDK